MKLTFNPTMRVELFAGFGAIVLVLVAILITAYVTLSETESSQRKMLDENFGNLYDLPTLRANINAQRLAVAMLLELDRSEWNPWLGEIQRRRRASDEIINSLILRLRNSSEESERLGAFIAVRDAYQRVVDTQVALLVEQGRSSMAKDLFLGIQMENHARMRALLAELEEIEMSEAHAMVKQAEENAGERMRVFLTLGVLGVLLASALAVYMSRTISNYVKELRARETAISRANRALNMLNACNSIMIRAADEIRLLEEICRSIIDIGGYKMTWVGYADEDKNKTVRPMAFAGEDGDYIEHANISWGDNERGRGPTGKCIRTGEVVIAADTSTEPGYDPWRYRAREKGYRSSATLPLRDSARVYGALMVYSGKANAFGEEEIRLLRELADDMAYATLALREQSARKHAEKKACESAAYARSLLEASLDPMVVISPSGKITDVNAATETATGKCRDELIGTDFSDCFADSDKARTGFKEALTHGFVRDYPLTILRESGGTLNVLYNASVYRNEAGEIQGVFAAAREVKDGSFQIERPKHSPEN